MFVILPETDVIYTTNKRFQIGDTVCFKANGFPIKK